MATTTKLILDERRAKDDGTFPIVIRLTHNRITRLIPTGFSVLPHEWNAEKETVISKSRKVQEVKTINSRIRQKQAAADGIILELEKFGELEKLEVNEVKLKIENKSTKVLFRDYAGKLVEELKAAKRLGNASCYQQASDFLDRHTDNKDLTFEQINFSMLKHLESRHIGNGHSWNSLSFYMRTIRAIFNRAIDEKVIKREVYPFDNYSIRETKPVKRAISRADIEKIKDLEAVPGSNMWHARNYFMFSFYNIGMNFADIAYLKMNNIINNRIQYDRAKTGKHYSVKISAPTQAILDMYTDSKKPDDFIFPIIRRDTPELQLLDLQNDRKTYNKWLKKIAKACKIESNLTSYVARHSWATIAKDLNVPISVISEGLGHEDIKTTQIYLDSFDDDVIDKANELIIG